MSSTICCSEEKETRRSSEQLIQKPANFSAPFLLMVDPKDCPRKEDWNPNLEIYKTWKYRVFGGNHGARAKLSLFDMYNKNVFAQVEAWVFAGLTKREQRILSWSHNIDQEYRKRMSNIDKIRACHTLFMEDNMNPSRELKWKCCDELDLPYNKNKRGTLSKHDHTFQIAFRIGEVWNLQDNFFDMWLKFETLGQKKHVSPTKPKGSKAKPAQPSVRALKKTSGILNLGHWRALQGLPNEEQVKRLLLRVVNRMISLEQMYYEGEKIQKVVKVKNVFLQVSGQPNWKACREMFPEETEASVLAAWIDKLGPEFQKLSKRKRKVMVGADIDEDVEEEIPIADVPPVFKSWVPGAIEKYYRWSNINSVAIKTSEYTWRNVDGDIYNYTINVGDVCKLDNVLQKKHYTLAVADIPYGFNAPGSEYDRSSVLGARRSQHGEQICKGFSIPHLEVCCHTFFVTGN